MVSSSEDSWSLPWKMDMQLVGNIEICNVLDIEVHLLTCIGIKYKLLNDSWLQKIALADVFLTTVVHFFDYDSFWNICPLNIYYWLLWKQKEDWTLIYFDIDIFPIRNLCLGCSGLGFVNFISQLIFWNKTLKRSHCQLNVVTLYCTLYHLSDWVKLLCVFVLVALTFA